MNSLDVYNQQGKKIDTFKFDARVFDGKVIPSLLQQVVAVFLANQRLGLASSKTRGDVRGGGKKPWRQKGTGRARVGSIRSPLWKGGGVIFGPKNKDYSKKVPQRMKVMALKSALNAKLNSKEIVVINDIKLDSHKTDNLSKILDKLNLRDTKAKLVVEKMDPNLKLASRNIPLVSLEKASELHTYGTLDCKRLVVTASSLKILENRVKKWLK